MMTRARFRSFPSILFALCLLLTSASNALAELKVPNIFTDNMVLQQQLANPVWGKADPGADLTVTIGSQTHKTQADAAGDWRVKLDPMPVTRDPLTMTVASAKGDSLSIKNILVGEVWICSGQSNMEWSVNASNAADLHKAAANYPEIRLINFPNVGRQEPVWSHDAYQWKVCSPDTLGDFSAVGYFFGRQLHQTLDVPVGLINNAWGGSAAEAWIRRDAMAGNPLYQPIIDRFDGFTATLKELEGKKELDAAEKKRKAQMSRQVYGNHNPANIYNGVLKSHLGYGIKGSIWYQGESNAGRAYQYRTLFPLMIETWRKDWGQGDFPFYWVQLADFRNEVAAPGESAWAELREAQTMALDKLPNVGQAVIIDVGEGKDIHPRNKVIVGQRLARLALVNDYGLKIAAQSPRYQSMSVDGNSIVLTFDHIGGGWRPFDVRELRGFTIAGADKKFVPATAVIQKDRTIRVSAKSVAEPVAVRYGWADNPVVNLFTFENLPLTPFRTDDWDGVTKGAL